MSSFKRILIFISQTIDSAYSFFWKQYIKVSQANELFKMSDTVRTVNG